MRIGICSDIHGNLEALQTVLQALEEHQPDHLICLGDVVGYGASPNQCCDLVRRHFKVCLVGNHDAAVSGRMDYSFYYDAARNALDWCRNILLDENREWLAQLPYTYQEGQTLYCHGSPLRPDAFEYIFAPEQARAVLPFVERIGRVNFIGHSHLCKVFALQSGEVHEVLSPRFRLRKNNQYIVSDGSVGQPRDYDPRAGYVIYDVDSEEISFYRVDYDIDKAAAKVLAANLPANFAKRLYLGV